MTSNKFQISVIIPLYNVEKHIKKCVNSLNKQTIDKSIIEYLFVDDGCSDNTISILKDSIDETLNYQILPKKNGGLSDARNYGIKFSSGKYISFVDSDDYLDSSFYVKMLNKMNESNFDIVMCETNWVYEKQTKVSKNRFSNCDSVEEKLDNLFYSSIAAWNKLYKKEIFENNEFTKNLLFEDLDFMFKICDKFNNIGFVNEPLYFYLQGRKTSILNKVSVKDFKSYDYIFETAIKKYKNTQYYKYVELYFIRRIVLSCSKKYLGTEYEKELTQIVEKYLPHFPNYKENYEYINSDFKIKFWINQVVNKKYTIIKLLKLIML